MRNNLNKNGDLNPIQLFLMGGALFSMHFGAASMMWPMQWGKMAGNQVGLVFIGAFITAVFMVVLTYIALSKTKGDFALAFKVAMGEKLGGIFAFIALTVMCLYVVPRMSAAVWDGILQATGYQPLSSWPLVGFTLAFYIIAYVFLVTPGKVMDKISRMLFPVLIIVVILIIGNGVLHPMGSFGTPSFNGNAFSFGFIQGYSTAEITTGLVFGVVLISNLKAKGIEENRMQKNIINVGIVGLGMLTLTHLGNMLVGATSVDVFPDLSYVQLYTAVSFKILGSIGGIVFIIAVFFAALTTAVGVGSAAGHYYEEETRGKLKYNHGIIICLVFSALLGCLGLTKLLDYVGPFLDAVYPAIIVMVLHLSVMPKCFQNNRLAACKLAMCVAIVFGVLDIFKAYSNMGILGGFGDWFISLYSNLPLYNDNLAWVPFVVTAYVVGLIVYRKKTGKVII